MSETRPHISARNDHDVSSVSVRLQPEPELAGPGPGPGPEQSKTLSFKPDPAVLKAAREKRKAAHARAAAERAAAEAMEDSEDEGPCKGDATSSDSED